MSAPDLVDRFRCWRCGHEWEQRPHEAWQYDRARLLGWSRAAEDQPNGGGCPKCASMYCDWLTSPLETGD